MENLPAMPIQPLGAAVIGVGVSLGVEETRLPYVIVVEYFIHQLVSYIRLSF